MPGAFGHLIGAWLCGTTRNYFCRQKLTRLQWAALLFGAIIPDVDFLFEWTIEDFHPHRTFTHSFLAAFLGGIVVYLLLRLFSHVRMTKIAKPATIALLFSFGMLTHIFLDLTTGPSGLQIFWPNHTWITLDGPLDHHSYPPTYDDLRRNVVMGTMDMGLGTLWLAYLFWRKKLRFD